MTNVKEKKVSIDEYGSTVITVIEEMEDGTRIMTRPPRVDWESFDECIRNIQICNMTGKTRFTFDEWMELINDK